MSLSNSPPVNSNYKVVTPPSPPTYSPEWFLFNFLDEWTPEDIGKAIRNNVEVDLSSAMGMIEDYVATEILEKFETYRPDLHKVLTSKEGREWLKRQIRTSIKK